MAKKNAETWVKRFWGRVSKAGPVPKHRPELGRCWLWLDASKRYGEVKKGGKKFLAHRMMFEMTKGPIPIGLYVCHHCDTLKCVNPEHLFVGTASDNTLDSVKKGRWPAAKLKSFQIRAIRRLHGTMPNRELAARFGLSLPGLEGVLYGRNWKHVA